MPNEDNLVKLQGRIRPATDGGEMPQLIFLQEPNEATYGGLDREEQLRHSMERQPPGKDSWYAVDIEYGADDPRNISLSLTVPTAQAWELGEARISRIGGPSREDLDFRKNLYFRIGAATVAGGRIESAMKRLVLLMTDGDALFFADVNQMWKALDRALRKAALAKGKYADDIVKLLDWADANQIREIRNDIVHAYWWDYAEVGIARGRFKEDGTSEMILISEAELDSQVRKLMWYADTLDSAVEDKWINGYLPRRPDDTGALH